MLVPVEYTPRDYQMPFLSAMDDGCKRAVLVWHRRSGKTKTVFNFTVKKIFERPGVYFHCFPEYGQGRKIIWDGMDGNGHKIIDLHAPEVIRKATNKTELKIEFINNGVYQIIGADNYNSIVGTNPFGIVLDEFSVSDKYLEAWDFFRPILTENGGWAVFVFTPRGRNHGWDIYQQAMGNPKWFCQLLSIENTKTVSREDIQEERDSGMSEEMIQQEYYCDFLTSMGDILVPFKYIQDAQTRDVNYQGAGRIAGLDPARFGNDRTGFVVRQGGQITYIDFWQGHDLTETVGKVTSMFNSMLFDCLAVDCIGIGAGVYDMIKNAGKIPVVPVNVAEAATDTKFRRMRDQLGWAVREWFADNSSISKGVPNNKKTAFIKDVQDIRFSYAPNGQIIIESKDDMKDRIGFSPDLFDALGCTFAPGIQTKLNNVKRSYLGNHAVPFSNEDNYNPLAFGL